STSPSTWARARRARRQRTSSAADRGTPLPPVGTAHGSPQVGRSDRQQLLLTPLVVCSGPGRATWAHPLLVAFTSRTAGTMPFAEHDRGVVFQAVLVVFHDGVHQPAEGLVDGEVV